MNANLERGGEIEPEANSGRRHEDSSGTSQSTTAALPTAGPAPEPLHGTSPPRWFTARAIGDALGVHRRTIHNRAALEAWPIRANGNRREYAPPFPVAATPAELRAANPPAVLFANAILSPRARARALARQEVVEFCLALRAGCPKELSLAKTLAEFAARPQDEFHCSLSQLRRWLARYQDYGLNGLTDQKAGRSGRRPVFVPDEVANRLKAHTIVHGSVARAVRQESANPELPSSLRDYMHAAHSSKSYVTPAIRQAATASMLTKTLARGPRAARLAGPWTPGDYANVKAGDVFVADDMTSNVYAWCEAPTACGYRIGQPQVLLVQDVGALRWLNARVIMREGGQYNALDDVCGLFGDVFDAFGLPRKGFLLEGGTWASKHVTGHRTGLSTDERIGGLRSLGLRIFRAWDPRGKATLEGALHQVQHVTDNFPGYAGREQRVDKPELFAKQLALCSPRRRGPAPRHPREFFPHLSQLATHVQDSLARLNDERQDGQILRGQAPNEKWVAEEAGRVRIPPEASWLYRSAKNIERVTRNGVRVTLGTGPKQLVYYFHAPFLTPWTGHKIVIFWNHNQPDTDALILDFQSRKLLGAAPRVRPLDRFNATDDQLEAEAQRKRESLHYARTELRAIQPEMTRLQSPLTLDHAAQEITRELAAADRRVVTRGRAQKSDARLAAAAQENLLRFRAGSGELQPAQTFEDEP